MQLAAQGTLALLEQAECLAAAALPPQQQHQPARRFLMRRIGLQQPGQGGNRSVVIAMHGLGLRQLEERPLPAQAQGLARRDTPIRRLIRKQVSAIEGDCFL